MTALGAVERVEMEEVRALVVAGLAVEVKLVGGLGVALKGAVASGAAEVASSERRATYRISPGRPPRARRNGCKCRHGLPRTRD